MAGWIIVCFRFVYHKKKVLKSDDQHGNQKRYFFAQYVIHLLFFCVCSFDDEETAYSNNNRIQFVPWGFVLRSSSDRSLTLDPCLRLGGGDTQKKIEHSKPRSQNSSCTLG